MSSASTITELDLADVERAVTLVEQQLGEDIARPLRLLLVWSSTVLTLLREKNLSIRWLGRMLFGPSTERTDDIVAAQDTNESAANKQSKEKPSKPRTSFGNGSKQPRRRSKGHGRTPSPYPKSDARKFKILQRCRNDTGKPIQAIRAVCDVLRQSSKETLAKGRTHGIQCGEANRLGLLKMKSSIPGVICWPP